MTVIVAVIVNVIVNVICIAKVNMILSMCYCECENDYVCA